MFDLGLGEMLVIAVLVIVFVGPDGLPDLMRVLGRFYGQMRRASDDLRRTFNAEVARVDADKRRDELRQRRLERERAHDAAVVPVSEPSDETDGDPVADAAPPADGAPRADAAPRPLPRPAPGAPRVPRPAAPATESGADPATSDPAASEPGAPRPFPADPTEH